MNVCFPKSTFLKWSSLQGKQTGRREQRAFSRAVLADCPSLGTEPENPSSAEGLAAKSNAFPESVYTASLTSALLVERLLTFAI